MEEMDTPLFELLTSVAFSLTVAGSTGIAPFLTLLVLAMIEYFWPDLLDMFEILENILGSRWCFIVLGITTFGELLSKCIPALDEATDSFEICLAPLLSVVATFCTLEMFPKPSEDDDGEEGFSKTVLITTKVLVVIAGMLLSLLLHCLKMIIRKSPIACAIGSFQPCMTTLEMAAVGCSIWYSIHIPIVAMVVSLTYVLGAFYVVVARCCCRKKSVDGCDDEDAAVAHGKEDVSDKTRPSFASMPENASNENESESNDVETPEVTDYPAEDAALLVEETSDGESANVSLHSDVEALGDTHSPDEATAAVLEDPSRGESANESPDKTTEVTSSATPSGSALPPEAGKSDLEASSADGK